MLVGVCCLKGQSRVQEAEGVSVLPRLRGTGGWQRDGRPLAFGPGQLTAGPVLGAVWVQG